MYLKLVFVEFNLKTRLYVIFLKPRLHERFLLRFLRAISSIERLKKSESVKNVLVLCNLVATILGDVLLHIIQKEKIGPKIDKARTVSALNGYKTANLMSVLKKKKIKLTLYMPRKAWRKF